MDILYLQQLLVLPGCPGNDRSYKLALQWQQKGHRITFVSSKAMLPHDHPCQDEEVSTIHGMTIYWIPVDYDHMMPFPKRIKAFINFFRKAFHLGKKLPRPDMLLAWSAPLSVAALGRRLANYHKTTFFLEVADVWPDVPIGMGIIKNPLLALFIQYGTKRIYKKASHIFCFSEGMREQILSHGVAPQKVSVSHNGTDIHQFTYQDRKIDKTTKVIYTGTIGIANDLTQVIRAIQFIRQQGIQNIHFTFVGHGNDSNRVQQLAQELKLSGLAFYKQMARDRMNKLLSDADIGIVSFAPYPVLEANSATKFFDYLSTGLPVVINYEGWQAKYLSEYACGLSSPQGDIDTFAQNLIHLAENPELRRTMGLNGRKLAERKFDREKLAQNMLEKFTETAVYLPA